jgi:uncharacterized protein YyaL (SSP411 family)
VSPPHNHLPQQNLLAREASPYLRQHADNPVHWRGWSSAALDEAKAQDKPILLSVGYAACHWCHVMAHESFENQDVAAVMNRLFVNIKVDREERPDIDQIYMAALSAMGEQGGWPLTMFLTPDGRPFWGGTYFPREPRYGRPGFVQVLEAVDKAWRDRRQDLDRSGQDLINHVGASLSASQVKAALTPKTLASLAGGIAGMVDRTLGGLRGAPKFPNAPFMTTLWLSWLRDGNADHRDAVLVSLERMLAGGIYDHIGGGLARYSTDADWLVPHFEKMLYDNAQLVRLANWAYAETGNDLFRVRIEETVTWLLREMRSDSGAFTSSLDADSDGEEGLFYTWTRQEIESALGEEADFFLTRLSLADPHGWEGKPILCQTPGQQEASITDRGRLAPLKARLLAVRETRIRPGRDDKVLTDWNGLAIAAIAEAGRSLGRPDWIEAAEQAFHVIGDTAREGRLPHSSLGERGLFPALSSDYAAMINAAIALRQATGNGAYTVKALHFLEELGRWHGDEATTGYYLTASDSTDVPIRVRGDVDEAMPSATAQIVEAIARLANLTGDVAMHDKAWRIAEHAMGRVAAQPYGQAGAVNACALLQEPFKLIVVESAQDSGLVAAANRIPDPRRVDIVLPIGAKDPPELPGGALPPTDRAAAYLCRGQVCLPAITDADELKRELRGASAD